MLAYFGRYYFSFRPTFDTYDCFKYRLLFVLNVCRGEYDLTRDDVLGEGRFLDSIGIFPEFVDGYNILVLPTSGRYFQVPYRCMVCPGITNLLVAGRCVAGDNTSHAAMRNMMACCVTG